MGPIILGNNNVSTITSYDTPIVIPVDIVSNTNVVLLKTFDITGFTNTGTGESVWYRDMQNGISKSIYGSDLFIIGNSISAYGSEKLRVDGGINATSYNMYTTISLYRDTSGNLVFKDPFRTITLNDLYNRSSLPTASQVNITDVDDYYTSGNVEGALKELGQYKTSFTAHNHANKSLLDSYTYSNTDISSAVLQSHSAVTTELPLQLSGQYLTLQQADSVTDGYLSAADFTIFDAKADFKPTIDSLESINSDIYSGILASRYISIAGYSVVYKVPFGAPGDILTVDNNNEVVFAPNTSSGPTDFVVPTGYVSISNEIGGITNANYPDVTTLNSKTLLDILQEMLFPSPVIPTFIFPSLSNHVINYNIISGGTITGNIVERGTTYEISPTATFNTNSSPSHSVYSNANVLYVNNVLETAPYSILQSSASNTIKTTYDYSENSSYTVVLANGTVITPKDFVGYPTSNRIVQISTTITGVDPIYYGCANSITSWSNVGNVINDSNVKSQLTKRISTEPISLTLNVASYTGSPDPNKYIIIMYPDSYGPLSSIMYIEGGNVNVMGSFISSSATYTRVSSDGTANPTYRVYYALNSFNSGGTITYTINF
jgi:hypothetical protein